MGIKEVANKLGYTPEQFLHSRVYKIKIQRYALMKCYKDKGMTLSEIAAIFDCHHATVINALRSLGYLMVYSYTQELVKEIYEA